MPSRDDDAERAVIRESVLARNIRVALQEHIRILLSAGWPRDRVDAMVKQCVDDAVRAHLTRRSSG